MKTRLLALTMVSALAATALAGCGGSDSGSKTADNGEWKWERKVEIICPWGTGGGADTTVRTFETAL